MITFHSVSWQEYYNDPARPGLWSEHYAGFRDLHEERMLFGPDVASYEAHERAGELEIVVIRKDSLMIGYCLAVVRRHKHYDALCAFEDSYFITAAERQGGLASKLVDRMNEVCKKRGAVKIYWMTKLMFNLSDLFLRKGMEHQDEVYAKWL